MKKSASRSDAGAGRRRRGHLWPGQRHGGVCAGRPGTGNKKITYSPYPAKTFPNRVYFGDTHLHTSYSADAGMIGTTLGPEDAYRFARGEEVKSNTGLPRQAGATARLSGRRRPRREPRPRAADRGIRPRTAQVGVGQEGTRPGQDRHHRTAARPTTTGGSRPCKLRGPAQGGRPRRSRRVEAHHRGRREIQRARPLHRLHRLRVDLGAERQQPAPQRDLPRRQGQGRPDHARSRTTTPRIPRSSGSGWPTYEKKTGGKLLAIPHNGNLSQRPDVR